MKLLEKILLALFSALLVATLGFVFWSAHPLGPAPEALAALHSDAQVTVTDGDFITFKPVNAQPVTGFIFYPGGRVDYRSYAAPLREIAARGYLVVSLRAPLSMAIFDVSAADPVFEAYPEIQHWVVGGHSLGGAVSAMYASRHLDRLNGIIFWASHPADESLRDSGLRFLSIYGTKDMAGMEKFEETKILLP